MRSQHTEEMKGQVVAHKTLIDTVRSQAEKIRESDMKNLRAQHQQETGLFILVSSFDLIDQLDLITRFELMQFPLIHSFVIMGAFIVVCMLTVSMV